MAASPGCCLAGYGMGSGSTAARYVQAFKRRCVARYRSAATSLKLEMT
ncbi:hypothetical protein B0G83_11694 [Paraburkholderia sp. BL21I4N1]|nr:hypothetical protein B0G83_11694 [Paraburkholderia sp. BL21I4N1]